MTKRQSAVLSNNEQPRTNAVHGGESNDAKLCPAKGDIVNNTTTPIRLSANFRLSTALPSCPTSSHPLISPLQQQPPSFIHSNRFGSLSSLPNRSSLETAGKSDWLPSSITAAGSVETTGTSGNYFLEFGSPLKQSNSMTSAAAATTAGGVKFDQQGGAAGSHSFAGVSNGSMPFSMGVAGWPGVNAASAVADPWELFGTLRTAAAFGRNGLDSRFLNASPYTNPTAGGYANVGAYNCMPQAYYGALGRAPAAVTAGSSLAPLPSCFPPSMGTHQQPQQVPFSTSSATTAAVSAGQFTTDTYYPYSGFTPYTGSTFSQPAAGNTVGNCNTSVGNNLLYANGMATLGGGFFQQTPSTYQCTQSKLDESQTASEANGQMPGTMTAGPSATASRKRPSSQRVSHKKPAAKKRKGATMASADGEPASSSTQSSSSQQDEPDNTRVFIWELDDLCTSVLSNSAFALQLAEHVLRFGFKLDGIELQDLDQSHIDEASIDEAAIHGVAGCYGSMLSHPEAAEYPPYTLGVKGEVEAVEINKPAIPTHGPAVANGDSLQGQQQQSTSGAGLVGEELAGIPHIATADSLAQRTMLENMQRIAASYSRIRHAYDTYKGRVEDLFSAFPASAEQLKAFSNYIFSNNPVVEGYRRCLRLVIERSVQTKDSCTNIVLAGESLPSALAKLLIFDMASWVPVENIYSVAKIPKEEALKRIGNRFKKKHAVVISSEGEMEMLAKKEGVPHWHVRHASDVNTFHLALDKILLCVDTPSTSDSSMGTGSTAITIPLAPLRTPISSAVAAAQTLLPLHDQSIYMATGKR